MSPYPKPHQVNDILFNPLMIHLNHLEIHTNTKYSMKAIRILVLLVTT